jgi:uncharacterized protein
MRLKRFRWDEENEGHLAKHEVSREEAEEACRIAPKVRRGKYGRYLVLGRTGEGRHLLVVLTYVGKGEARPITARKMDAKERALYKRK